MNPSASLPIGIFDSGMGGLTVLKAISGRLPGENLLYLGDTARLPYGTKSRDTIIRYTLKAAGRLVDEGVKMLVVACNTATSAALPESISSPASETPSLIDPALPARYRAAPAFRSTAFRVGPASPFRMRNVISAFSFGGPPVRSDLEQRAKPKSSGVMV